MEEITARRPDLPEGVREDTETHTETQQLVRMSTSMTPSGYFSYNLSRFSVCALCSS